MKKDTLFLRIDVEPFDDKFIFNAQLCIGDEANGVATGLRSEPFAFEDEHDQFVAIMQRATVCFLKAQEFSKKVDVQQPTIEKPDDDGPMIITLN